MVDQLLLARMLYDIFSKLLKLNLFTLLEINRISKYFSCFFLRLKTNLDISNSNHFLNLHDRNQIGSIAIERSVP